MQKFRNEQNINILSKTPSCLYNQKISCSPAHLQGLEADGNKVEVYIKSCYLFVEFALTLRPGKPQTLVWSGSA